MLDLAASQQLDSTSPLFTTTDNDNTFYSAIDPKTGEKLVIKINEDVAVAYLNNTRIIREYRLTQINIVRCLGEKAF